MNLRKMITSLFISLLIFFLIFTTCVNAVTGYASSIGTTYKDIDTREASAYAALCYKNYGYSTSNNPIDPSFATRVSATKATVQFYDEHGNVDNVCGSKSGIYIGNDIEDNGRRFVGLNESVKFNNPVLVTYLACYTAGIDDLDNNSITVKTAQKGAKIVVGFKSKIQPSSSNSWAERYNKKLSEGAGVYDAASYANKFIYINSSIKNNHLIYSISENLNLAGNYANLRSLDNDNLISTNFYSLNATNENFSSVIESIDSEFNIENYEIIRTKGAEKTNIVTGETISKEYVDFVFKIGDFITEAGYVIELEDNKIIGLYDRNIDIVKQKEALLKKDNFLINENSLKIKSNSRFNNEVISLDNITEMAVESVKDKYDSNIFSTKEINTKYYYDISSEKKYIITDVITNIKSGDLNSFASDSIFTEIEL